MRKEKINKPVKFIDYIKYDVISIMDERKVEKGNTCVEEVNFKGALGR